MRKCLIVDDSRVVRKVASRIATELGFQCVEAEDGQKAYESCMVSMPDLVLLDWNMPVMSGLDFIVKLRQMENGHHPKVIFCTTENDMAHIQKAIGAGADEYIMKPFDTEIVQSKLVQVGMMESS